MGKKKRSKKFNISNRLAYTLIIVFLIVLLGIGVYAYNLPPPTNVGHTTNEIAWPTCSSGQVLGISGSNVVCVTPIDSRFTITSNGLCYNSPATCGELTTKRCEWHPNIYVYCEEHQSDINYLCAQHCLYNPPSNECNGDIGTFCTGGTQAYLSGNYLNYALTTGFCDITAPNGRSGDVIMCHCVTNVYYNQENLLAAGQRCI